MALTRVRTGGGVLDQTTTLASVVNTTTATNLFTLALPAGRLVAGDVVRFKAAGDMLNNSGSSTTITFKARINTTAIMNVAVTVAANANRQFWLLDMDVHIVSGTGQIALGRFDVSNPTNITNAALTTAYCNVGATNTAVDTSTSQLLKLEVTHGAAAATIDARVWAASATLLREAA